jgi:hypothetical protein
MFRGRAAEKLSRYMVARNWRDFMSCPYEELVDPSRLHVDSYGNLQICQGICIGNVWERPIETLIRNYSPHHHPICGPLTEGGPAQLAKSLGDAPPEEGVADACHLGWLTRRSCRGKFHGILEPAQVYCEK